MGEMLFLNALKKFLVKTCEDNDLSQSEASGYYETFLQQLKDIDYIFKDIAAHHFELQYDPDMTGGYTNGNIIVQLLKSTENPLKYADYHYEIKLLTDPRYYGYCQCSPDDEGFDPINDCCGDGCDWSAPRVEITKVQGMAAFSFNGIERSLWSAFKKWEEDLGINHTNRVHEAVAQIDEQVQSLLETKQSLLNTLAQEQ